MRTTRRTAIAALIGSGALVITAGAAAAHVETDPSTVKPGKAVTVAFTPEHGCEDSPIIEMKFRVPKDAEDASPVAKDGWTTKATARTVTFTGGSMPSDATDAFSISFTAPKAKGELTWKVVQRCEQGVERWIEPQDGEFPAPVLGVGKQVTDGHGD
jgi:uncharacterized protein YcnI